MELVFSDVWFGICVKHYYMLFVHNTFMWLLNWYLILYTLFCYLFGINDAIKLDFVVGIKRKRDDTDGEVIGSESRRVDKRFNKFHLLPELRARLTDGRI